jgi:hypothetical protein
MYVIYFFVVATAGVPPGPRLNHATAVVGSNLYVFGGFQDGEARADLFKFDTRAFHH